VVVDLRLTVGAADVRCTDLDGMKRVVSVQEMRYLASQAPLHCLRSHAYIPQLLAEPYR
jgi:hypothetical protein